MKIADGLEMLEISSNVMGRSSVIYPALLLDNGSVILVDAGFPGQLSCFREEFENAGILFHALKKVIITHHDIDHIGSLLSMKKYLPNLVIYSHEVEKAYIQGDKTPLKITQIEVNLNKLPEDMKIIYDKLKSGFQNSFVNVDETLTDGQILPYCGGMTVIFTPGHTLGHICLYLNKNKILIAGDALSVVNGTLVKTQASTHFDPELYKDSLKKLTNYDIKGVICYHGGFYEGNVTERIKDLIEED